MPACNLDKSEVIDDVDGVVEAGAFRIRIEDLERIHNEYSHENTLNAIARVVNARQRKGKPAPESSSDSINMKNAINCIMNSKRRRGDSIKRPEEELN